MHRRAHHDDADSRDARREGNSAAGKKGLATLCVSGGMGVAVEIETCEAQVRPGQVWPRPVTITRGRDCEPRSRGLRRQNHDETALSTCATIPQYDYLRSRFQSSGYSGESHANSSSQAKVLGKCGRGGTCWRHCRRSPRNLNSSQFVVEGSVARLTLNRPEHNMLNERMLAELAAGIDSLEGAGRETDRAGFGDAILLRRYRAGRIHAAARVSGARRVSTHIYGHAGHGEAAAGDRQWARVWRRRGIRGAGRPGDRDAAREIRAAGNQARRVSAAGRRDPAVHRWGRSARWNWCLRAK